MLKSSILLFDNVLYVSMNVFETKLTFFRDVDPTINSRLVDNIFRFSKKKTIKICLEPT